MIGWPANSTLSDLVVLTIGLRKSFADRGALRAATLGQETKPTAAQNLLCRHGRMVLDPLASFICAKTSSMVMDDPDDVHHH